MHGRSWRAVPGSLLFRVICKDKAFVSIDTSTHSQKQHVWYNEICYKTRFFMLTTGPVSICESGCSAVQFECLSNSFNFWWQSWQGILFLSLVKREALVAQCLYLPHVSRSACILKSADLRRLQRSLTVTGTIYGKRKDSRQKSVKYLSRKGAQETVMLKDKVKIQIILIYMLFRPFFQ